MDKGISPVISAVLLIAIAVIGSVTVWFWASTYTTRPALAETGLKAFTITIAYKNASGNGCSAIEIRNSGGAPISNVAFEIRDYVTGKPAGANGTYSSVPNWYSTLGLVSYWKFDFNSNDYTSNGNNGTFYGEQLNNGNYYGETMYSGAFNNTPTWVVGKYGTSLNFDGTPKFVYTKRNLATVTDSFTMMLWAYPTAEHQIDPETTSSTTGTSGQKYAIWADQGDSTWGAGHSGAGISIGTNGVSVYEHAAGWMPPLLVYQGSVTGWNHIAIVYTNKQPVLYLNGNPARTGLTSYKIVHPTIGNWSTAGGFGGGIYGYFNGAVDSVRIFNKNLNQTEIQAEMNSPRPVIRPVANWEFDENGGTEANDTHIWLSGKNGSALSFDGIGNYVYTNITQLSNKQAFSASAWYKVAIPFMNWTNMLSLELTNNTAWSAMRFEATHNLTHTKFYLYAPSTCSPESQFIYTNDEWVHLAMTSNSTNVLFYVNGVQTGCAIATWPPGFKLTGDVYMARRNGTINAYNNGTLDSVRIWNRSLTQAEIHAETVSSRPVIKPVASFEFEQESGTMVEETHTLLQGKFAGAYNFDGADDYVNIPYSPKLNISSQITISAWIYPVSYHLLGYGGIICHISGKNNSRFLVGNDGTTVAQVIIGGSAQSVYGPAATNNAWNHVIYRYNGTHETIFTNSVKGADYAKVNTISYGTMDPVIGWGYSTHAFYHFNGTIDDIAIFNRSLTDSEITQLYSNGQYALDQVPGPTQQTYVNISGELVGGDSRAYNISFGQASNITSLPFGTYILRSSSQGVSDQIFTCS